MEKNNVYSCSVNHLFKYIYSIYGYIMNHLIYYIYYINIIDIINHIFFVKNIMMLYTGLVVSNMVLFSIIHGIILPIDFHIFQRG